MAYNYLTDTGIIVADTSSTLAEVQDEFKAIFGNDIDLNPAGVIGLLISQEVLTRDSVARYSALLANQINPNFAGGIFLDAIAKLTGLSRQQATYSTITAVLTGTPGTVISAGTRAQTTNNDVFALTTTVTIGTDGTVSATFQAEVLGAIPVLANTLTKILDTTLGLDSINNPTAGTLGLTTQTDLEFRTLRNDTLSIYGQGTIDAISSALYNVLNVQSLQGRENTADTTTIIDTISMKPHSIYFCVNGGLDSDVANAIYQNRSAGSDFNGSTIVPITSKSGQIINILFDRPTVISLLAKITVRISGSATSAQISQAIEDHAKTFKVGVNVSAFELVSAAAQISGVYVVSSEIAPADTGIYQTSEITININEIASLTASGITVIVQ